MLVVLVGIDGSGKSTAARSLQDHIHGRGGRSLLLPNHAGRRSISTWCAAHDVRLHPRLADLVETALRVGHVLVNHVRASRFNGLVLMDRHLYCQLALRSTRGLPRGRLLPWLLRHLPRPDLVVLLDVSPQQAQARIKRRGTDDETLQFLEAFSAAYRALPEYPTFAIVSAGGTPTETMNRLIDLVAPASPQPIADEQSQSG